MKILLINKYHYLKGGAERAYFDTAKILEKHGHTVAFFSMRHSKNKPTKWAKYFVSEVDYNASYSISQKARIVKNMLWNREAQKNLEVLLKEFKPDIAHLHNTYHQLSPSIISTLKKYKVPVVMTLHDYKLTCPNYSMFARGKIWEGGSAQCVFDRCVKNSYAKSLVCAFESILHQLLGMYRKVDAYIAPSKFLIGIFKERGFSKEIKHVPQPLMESDVAKDSVVYSDGSLVFVGRLTEEKGVDVILHALKELPGERLRILADGPKRQSLEMLAKSLKVADRVTFLGHVSQETVRAELARAKAVIMPSVWYENMPYALLESLAAGRIVIASRIGGMTERISHGKNGLLFNPGDAKDLAKNICLLKEYDLKQISKNASESVRDLDPEEYYRQIMMIYNQVY